MCICLSVYLWDWEIFVDISFFFYINFSMTVCVLLLQFNSVWVFINNFMKKFSCSTKSVMCFLKKEKNNKILTSTTAATTAINDKLLQNSLIQYLARSRKKLVFTFVYRNCLFFHKIVLYSTNTKKKTSNERRTNNRQIFCIKWPKHKHKRTFSTSFITDQFIWFFVVNCCCWCCHLVAQSQQQLQ